MSPIQTTEGEIRYRIGEAAELLDRSPHTLRSWDRNESMPDDLRPYRDELGHRYWTPELIERIKAWIQENDFHPGRGIGYHPTPERLKQHIAKIRTTPRSGNVTSDEQLAGLRSMIEEAIFDLGTPPERIIEMLPTVVKDYGIPLDQALRVAADVITQSSDAH